MREYDSDTGYRSDQELMKFRRQQQQMYEHHSDNYSEIVPVTRSRSHRKDGYSSDLEGYSQRSMVAAYREQNTQESAQNSSTIRSPSNQNITTVRNDELYTGNPMQPSSIQYPSSPSPLQRHNVVDQSTPLTPSASRREPGKHGSETEWKNDLFNLNNNVHNLSVLDPENRYMVSNLLSEFHPTNLVLYANSVVFFYDMLCDSKSVKKAMSEM